MGEVIELEIPARPEYLDLARMVVGNAAALDAHVAPQQINDLRLAVSEACTNAIEAQVAASRDEGIAILCRFDEDKIEVEVRDRGGGFDPGGVAPLPEPDDPARLDYERGLGITLMRSLTDETDFVAREEGMAVRLVLYTDNGR